MSLYDERRQLFFLNKLCDL